MFDEVSSIGSFEELENKINSTSVDKVKLLASKIRSVDKK